MDEFLRPPKRSPLDADETPSRADNTSLSGPSNPNVAPLPINQSGDKTLLSKFKFRLPNFRKPRNKKEWIIAIAAAVLLLGGISFAVYWFVLRDNAPLALEQPAPATEPEPTTVASKLSGLQVEKEVNERPIFSVQIENSSEARPQSGLIDADLVFEAVAEGGITRFNALFHDKHPKNIGPIRSLRPYYIDWFWPFDAAIVHAGGSGEALSDVKRLKLKDIEHGVNGDAFRRVSSRYSPHNLYSTSSDLLKVMSRRGYKESKFMSLNRKEPAPSETLTATTINLKISSALYNVSYSYDKKSNRYVRSQGGAKHIDAESKKQISASTIIVPVLSKSIHPNGIHTRYSTTGSGKVYIFQDGVVTIGTWKKASRQEQWKFVDASDKDIHLNTGTTWVTMVDSGSAATYTAPAPATTN
ncbi:MAG: DUF3048 domain-containing protein [bacterium]|nr:DUF3048 domain-containing protein [bacterium]